MHDARLAAGKLAAASVPVEVRAWPGQVPVFQIAATVVPEAARSLRQIGDYIREATTAVVRIPTRSPGRGSRFARPPQVERLAPET